MGKAAGRTERSAPEGARSRTSLASEARKSLVGQVLAISLTPVSVAATLYFTDAAKRPRPRIEYVSVHPEYAVKKPDDGIKGEVIGNALLAFTLREDLGRVHDE